MSPDERFERCVDFVMGPSIEGGYCNRAIDKGGPTNHGITQATLADYRGRPCSVDDVKALTAAEAKAIYRKNYWAAIHGDELPAGVDLMTFDLAVNSGPQRAKRYLQIAAGVVDDGVIGPGTLKAIALAKPLHIIDTMRATRNTFYRAQPTVDDNPGWFNRLAAVTDQAQRWA
jgi:lysozyme family protein